MFKLKAYMEDLYRFRFLLSELVKRDLIVKYKKSILGILWSVLQPLFIMSVMIIIFSQIFNNTVPNYPIYILIGKIMWDLFSQTTTYGMDSIVMSANLIKKVYIPKYIFPLSKSVTAVVNLLLSLVGMTVLMLILGVPFSFKMLFVVFPIFYMWLFGLGLAYILATYVIFFRDLNYLFEVLLNAWMYFSALFYTPDILGRYEYLLDFNPAFRFIDMFRQIVLYQHLPSLSDHLIGLAIGVVTMSLGLLALKHKQDRFILYF